MIALIQRVQRASVTVEQRITGQIEQGLLVLLCAEKNDTPAIGEKLLNKVLAYRVFSDEAGKMNRSVLDTNGAILAVSQFTLLGDARDGLLRDWPVVGAGVEKHYGYAFQWFGLCGLIALLYVWFQIVRRFIRPRSQPAA
mgnify:CR=1 FL=1